MGPVRRVLLPVVVLLLVFPAVCQAAYKPAAKALYHDGPDGRYLLAGDWYFKLDNEDQGIKQRFYKRTSTAGWKVVRVPNVWNLGDASNESMAGGIGWYRKDFELPQSGSALAWALRFESVNYRARVWLNGVEVGHNTGAYIPFEFGLNHVKRTGTNRLVVRVDSRRLTRDFPPAGLNADGVPTGGWWNYSGIQREVYLRKLDEADFQKVLVRPLLPCASCPATVQMRIDLRNVGAARRPFSITGRFGTRSVHLKRVGKT